MVLRCLAFTEHFLLVLLPLGLLQDQQCVKHRLCPHNAPGTPQQLGKEDTLAHLTAVCRSVVEDKTCCLLGAGLTMSLASCTH